MLLQSFILIAAAWTAPGEIYRCPKPDGSASYQDRPCSGAAIGRPQDRLATGDDPRALREWLSHYRQSPAQVAPARARDGASPSVPAAPRRNAGGPLPPLDEHRLAVCSERFYVCADSDGGRMDSCVARTAHCGAEVASSCCPAETLACYRDLRSSGSSPAEAVRGALLGPACGT